MEAKDKIKEILNKYPQSIQEVEVSKLTPNPWNPNVQPPIIFESLKKSIMKYGWIQFPVVREYVGEYQVIDGEHRSRAAKELKLEKVRCVVLGDSNNEVSDEDAKILTQLLNTRGQDDVLKRAELLRSIKNSNQPDLFDLLPMKAKEIEEQLDLLNFDFSQYENAKVDEKEVNRAQDALALALKLDKELRKLHSESNNTKLRLLLEQYFEWFKVLSANIEK